MKKKGFPQMDVADRGQVLGSAGRVLVMREGRFVDDTRAGAGLHGVGIPPDGQSLPSRRTRVNGFLLDENLPGGLSFSPSLPVSHALDLGANPTDSELWSFAKERCLVIVTKDADFLIGFL